MNERLPRASVPRLGVSVGVWRGDRVLLVKRGGQTYGGLWSFPGGHVEWGERLADAYPARGNLASEIADMLPRAATE